MKYFNRTVKGVNVKKVVNGKEVVEFIPGAKLSQIQAAVGEDKAEAATKIYRLKEEDFFKYAECKESK